MTDCTSHATEIDRLTILIEREILDGRGYGDVEVAAQKQRLVHYDARRHGFACCESGRRVCRTR